MSITNIHPHKAGYIILIIAGIAAITACAGIFVITDDSNAEYSGKCGENLTWEYREYNSTLTISGFGKMDDWGDYEDRYGRDCHSDPPWNDYRYRIHAVILPEGLTHIGNRAFFDFTALASITIPKNVSSIGENAFRGSSVSTIDTYADIGFDCRHDGLATDVKITCHRCGYDLIWEYDESSETLTFIGSGAMDDYAPNAPWSSYRWNIRNIVLPEGLTSIGDFAFYGLSHVITVTLPETVESVGMGAFCECDGLTSVTMPSVKNLGPWVFLGCDGLTSVTIPYSMESVGTMAFEGCPMETVDNYSKIDLSSERYCLPDSVNIISHDCGTDLIWKFTENDGKLTFLGSGAMYDYGPGETPWYGLSGSIKEIVLPERLTHIGGNAFYGCGSVKMVAIPETVTSIGGGAFENCGSLTTVFNYSGIGIENGQYGLSEDAKVFTKQVCGDGLTWEHDSKKHTLTIKGTGAMYDYDGVGAQWRDLSGVVTDIVLPDGLTHIGSNAFRGFTEVRSVSIPETVGSIGDGAFAMCSALTAADIPDSVTVIGDYAFHRCYALASVNIPGSIETIGGESFSFCTALTSLTVPMTEATVGENAFYQCSSLASVEIGSVKAIGEGAFCLCGSLTSLKIGSADTIGEGAFCSCSELTAVTVPDTVKEIAGYTFQYCFKLRSVSLPDSVETIGESAFYGCLALSSLTLPGSLTSIGENAFCYCSSLTALTIPGSVGSIGENAFLFCQNLATVFNFSHVAIEKGQYGLSDDVEIFTDRCGDGLK